MKMSLAGKEGKSRVLILSGALAIFAFAQLHPLAATPQDADASGQSFYADAKPMLDFPLPDLLKAIPELEGLDPAASQDDLPSILSKTGEVTEDLMGSMPNLTSREDVTQSKPGGKGKDREQIQREFDYMIVVHWNGADGTVEEYRSASKGAGLEVDNRSQGYMLTSGFASEWLQFLPPNQLVSRFRYLGQQTFGGFKCYVVAFAQVPGTTSITGTVHFEGRSVLLLYQGIAWIDESTFRIVRFRTDLLAPHPEITLESQTTELQFGNTTLAETAAPLWLPQGVVVTTQMHDRLYRNVHRYSDYRVFKVESKILPAPADEPPPTKPN